jgi:NitT/TauT family transport system permease protein
MRISPDRIFDGAFSMEIHLSYHFKPFLRKYGRWLLPVSILLIFLIWLAVSHWARLPHFILPSPGRVVMRFWQAVMDGSLLRHTLSTLLEVVLGMGVGVFLATLLGYALARSPLLEKTLSPYLVASQAVPVVAIAPLLVIWFGPGLGSKVIICALTVFFPVLVNTIVGLRAVPRELRELMHSLRADRRQMLRYLEIPAALPIFLGGLRIGATLSVIGAVVGEFVGSDRGLGFLVNIGRNQYDTALVFVAVFTLILLAVCLYGLVVLAERRWLGWMRQPSPFQEVD